MPAVASHQLRKTTALRGAGPSASPLASSAVAASSSTAATVPRASVPTSPAPVARVAPRAPSSGPAAPVRAVVVPGAAAPLLLPDRGADTYRAWADGVRGSAVLDANLTAKLPASSSGDASLPTDVPIIGVIANDLDGVVDDDVTDICELVRGMGCAPVIIPPLADTATKGGAAKDAVARGLLANLCGLIGPGGADIDPALYGAKPTFARGWNPVRDQFEARLVARALDADLYMFGICRSHQLWNAVAGGALVQDVVAEGYSKVSQKQTDHGVPLAEPFVLKDDDGNVVFENKVELEAGSDLRATVGHDALVTNSLHHQAVAVPGKGMRATGVVHDGATGKATIEATERWNGMTTQWHPELMLKDKSEMRLLSTVGRRAHVFFAVRALRAAGGRVDAERVLAKIDPRRLNDADRAWVRRELAPRL